MRFLVILLGVMSSLFGVVSIAPVEIGDKPGVSGAVEASVQNARGNTNKDEYKGSFKIQYDNNSSFVTWGETSANYAEVDGVKNTNQTYTHLRYIHTFFEKKDINYELFAQSQTDEFTKIRHRFLGGGGYRFHILDKKMGKVYIGTGVFYEYINYTTPLDPQEKNVRGNLYLAYTKKFENDAKVSYVGYYQPVLKEFNDYIVTNTLELEVNIYKKLFLSLKANYNYDAKPAFEVKKEDFTQTTSLKYKF